MLFVPLYLSHKAITLNRKAGAGEPCCLPYVPEPPRCVMIVWAFAAGYGKEVKILFHAAPDF